METIWVERLKEVEGEVKWVQEPETFDLQKDFAIDDSNLEKAICEMGHILVRYGTVAAEVSANLERKKEELKTVEAKVSNAERSQAEESGAKMTEAKLQEKVILSDYYQQALLPLHTLRADEGKLDHWYRSAIKKADLLQTLGYRQNAELKRTF